MNPGALSQVLFGSRYADQYGANVISAFHFDDGLGAAPVDMISGNNWVNSGTAFGIHEANTKFGSGSLKANVSSYYYMSGIDTSRWALTGDFSIECWIYMTGNGSLGAAFALDTSTIQTISLTFGPTYVRLRYGVLGGLDASPSGGGDIRGRWVHAFVGRSGTTNYAACDGNMTSTSAASALTGTVTAISICSFPSTAPPNDFIMDDFRVTKGVCRYTANFTPPTAPFPNP